MKWQYCIAYIYPGMYRESRLASLGAEGWELVTIVPSEPGPGPEFVFKRPVATAAAERYAECVKLRADNEQLRANLDKGLKREQALIDLLAATNVCKT